MGVKNWIVFERADNKRIGLFDSNSKCRRAEGEVITTFTGTFEEALVYIDSLEKLRKTLVDIPQLQFACGMVTENKE